MTAILPEEDLDDLPTGFSIVGHVGIVHQITVCHA